ncbi:hypothetical protein ACFL5O_01850 [Myxococcota bacterium]
MKFTVVLGLAAAVLGISQVSVPALRAVRPAASLVQPRSMAKSPAEVGRTSRNSRASAVSSKREPVTVLMRTGHWFVYPRGCETVRQRRDVVLLFHGAPTTVIPRFIASNLDAVLVVINKGIGSGPYSRALALASQVDGLLARVQVAIADQCDLEDATISRLALSSWSAGYGAIQQFLRKRPEHVDAVLLADGLHVGFVDHKYRKVATQQLNEFSEFARQASRGEKLMMITHSAILPPEYAGAAETAMALSQAAHAPTWPVTHHKHGMRQLTAARRGHFYAEGYAGNDKAAHARHLYSIGETLFTRLREYWERS